MTQRIAFYPGSFDPVTNGHVDMIARAARLVDTLVIAVGVHDAKRPLFSAAERITLLQAVIDDLGQETAARIKIVTFDDLAIEAAQRAGATMFIRGLRDGTDLDYEAQLAGMNAAMAPGVETIFLPASASVRHIAANLVRQIALMGGNVAHFVAPVVEAALIAKRGS